VYVVGGAVVVGASLLAVRATLHKPAWLPAAALAGAAAVLLYARLLGRLGWLVVFRSPQPSAAQTPPEGRKNKKRGPLRGATAYDPGAIPEKEAAEPEEAGPPQGQVEEEDEWAPPTPYGLAKETAARQAAPSPKRAAADPVEGYVLDRDQPR